MEFSDVEIEKKGFHSSKKAVDLDKMDIEKILVSNEFAHEKKTEETDARYFIGYKTGKTKIGPLLFSKLLI